MTVRIDDENVRRIAGAMAERGHSIVVVGGPIRSVLLGQPPSDIDMATSAMPAETRAALSPLGSVFLQGERFGTVGVVMAGADGTPEKYEVTTYRGDEVYGAGSRRPEVRLGVSLDEDLMRRDFTVNAMAADPMTGEVFDPLGGCADLEAGILRTPMDPDVTFRDDPLRVARAIRFSSVLGFELAPETLAGARRNAHLLGGIPQERRTDEIRKILSKGQADAIRIAATRSEEVGATRELWGGLNVTAAGSADLSAVPPRSRLAALAYATGPQAGRIMRQMTFSNDEVSAAERVAASAAASEAVQSLPQARMLVRAYADDELNDAGEISAAFGRPHGPLVAQARQEAELLRRPLPVNGNDAKGLGLQGRDIGEWLRAVESRLMENPRLSRKEALGLSGCRAG